ncbi:BMC domain-containing protein [Desulfovibrio intestinalis]|uniref:Microcompartment protein CcmL/EutN n=1 Tax=Desulfovibrio intestinalis TaxID=58621 RepID=A0A7W8FGV5_9BACT|nr:microcompartment protein CcmL/EutN [Desulfovibrio intestinalis]
MLALGLIETKGLIGAIEAADAMLKAADVRLLEKTLATGGLVTITIAGEVAAVQSAVDAARASLTRLEGAVCVSCHVIPRPDGGLEKILLLQPGGQTPAAPASPAPAAAKAETVETEIIKIVEIVEETPAPAAPQGGAKAGDGTQATAQNGQEAYDPEKCKAMSMNKLRQLARTMKVELTREQIASSNRQTLMNAIDRAARKEKE